MNNKYYYKLLILISLVMTVLINDAEINAQSWGFGKNKVQYKEFDWHVLKTPHFDIHFSEGYIDLAARTGVILEDGYRDLAESLEHNIKSRIPVIIYSSHSAFQQTNTTWSLIPEGVQAFADPNRGRVVLHFNGSNVDYRNTAVHELIHIFEFDMIYGNLLRSVFSRNMLFRIPLWLAEGCSEYYSKGYDDEAEMYMRDAAIFDYLPRNLDYTGGYMVYKAGQSVVDYIVRTYGQRKMIDIISRLSETRSIELALNETIGLSTEDLTGRWAKSLRRRYWPLYADKMEPEKYGRRLTDHQKGHYYRNAKPIMSPDGESIIYYSDRDGLDGLYLMNSITGEIEETLIKGQMSDEFESLRILKSNLTISPDGSQIAFVAKSGGINKLFLMEVPGGKIVSKINIPLDFFFSPAWSPKGDVIAFVGVKEGQSDLYLYRIGEGSIARLTRDVEDEKDPSWFPDGERLAYCRSPRVVPNPGYYSEGDNKDIEISIDYFHTEIEMGLSKSNVWSLEIATGIKRRVFNTKGDDSFPIIIQGGKEIVFASNESGIWNLYRGSVELGKYYRFTDVLGGIFSSGYSSSKDRLVFSAFDAAGYDLFVIDSFTKKSKTSYSTGVSEVLESAVNGDVNEIIDTTYVFKEGEREEKVPDLAEKGPGMKTESYGSGEDEFEPLDSVYAEQSDKQSVDRQSEYAAITESAQEIPEIVIDEDIEEDIDPDTLSVLRERMKKKIGTVQPYKTSFSPDYIGNGMGLFYSTGFGFGLMNQIAFSDLLGDHHLYLSFNIHRSIEDSDIMLSYYYLRKRFDYAFGVFQFKSYLNSRTTSLGEAFLDYRMFTERNYGLFGMISYPFSTFTRLDMEMQGYVSQREYFENLGSYYFVTTGEKNSRRLFQPTVSLVHDTAYYGSFGPVIGSKWMLSFSRSLSFFSDDLVRSTAFYDYRKYTPLFYRNYLAFRTVGSVSIGKDSRYFFLGGPVTMRGYDYLQFQGSRMMLFNLEYRYPLVDAIIFGWPGRWALTNIGGTFFFDTGSVWGDNRYVEMLPPGIGPTDINNLKFYSDFGVGFYMRLSMLILNFQLGWPTDFSNTGSPVFHFYMGPQF